jgi:hypothetical protein
MISLEAGVDAEVHLTQLAHNPTPPSTRPTPGTEHTLACYVRVLWPVTHSGSAPSSWHVRLHMGAWGRIGGCYLLQQLLAELQHTVLDVGVYTPQLVGINNAHIE